MDELVVTESNEINTELAKPSLDKKDVCCEQFFSPDIPAQQKNATSISEKNCSWDFAEHFLNETNMGVNPSSIKLHPHAKEFLYKHYRTVSKIFKNVLSLHEIDYLSIALITPENELLFISSQPAIEFNLIEHNLWQIDPSFHEDFFQQDKMKLWEELYAKEELDLLRYYRQYAQSYRTGLAIPAVFEQYRAVYSFALKSNDKKIKNQIINNTETLVNIGQSCLKSILMEIPLPDKQKTPVVSNTQSNI